MLFCLLLALPFSVLFILSPLLHVERYSASASSLRCSSRCPCTRDAPLSSFHHWLAGCGSVSDSHHLLLGCGSVSDPLERHFAVSYISWISRLHLQHHYSALRPSAVGARALWLCSLQQSVLLAMRVSLVFWKIRCRCGPSVVSNTTPTPLCGSLTTKAYIAASCHGVVRRFVRHHWRVIDPRFSFFWFLSLVLSLSYSASIARLVLDASLLHGTRERPTLLNCAVQSFCWMRNSVFSFLFCLLPSSVFLLNVASSSERLLFFLAVHRLSAECGHLC